MENTRQHAPRSMNQATVGQVVRRLWIVLLAPLSLVTMAHAQQPGDLDLSFGVGGLATQDNGFFSVDATDTFHALALQPDGKIVAAGHSVARGRFETLLVVARFEDDGALDPSFGIGGLTSLQIPPVTSSLNTLSDVAILPDGRILAFGVAQRILSSGQTRSQVLLFRLASDGTIDTSFGNAGIATVELDDFGGQSAPRVFALQDDGRMVVAGSGRTSTAPQSFILARFLADGSLDPSFGTAGRVFLDPPSATGGLPVGVTVRPDGKILMAAYCQGCTGGPNLLASFDATGALDPTFGVGGMAEQSFDPGNTSERPARMVFHNGKIWLLGNLDQADGQKKYYLSRFADDGSIDPSFGNLGSLSHHLVDDAWMFFSDLTPCGDGVLVGGYVTQDGNHTALVAHSSGGSLDPTFGVDGETITNHPGSNEILATLQVDLGGDVLAAGYVSESEDRFERRRDFALARHHAVCGSGDSDADGVTDDNDNCPTVANPLQEDNDLDGVGDACDPLDDRDFDGIDDAVDNCPLLYNPGQADLDSDGQGDLCDLDDDGDGIGDAVDNCPLDPNPGQGDANGNGLGDVCDTDADFDGVEDGSDNCPATPNPDQSDADGDGQGDLCDADIDGDGLPNGTDNCPLTSNAHQADLDGDGIGDACDDDTDGDGHAQSNDNCPLTPNPEQTDTDNDGLGDVCDDDDDGDAIPDGADLCPLIPDSGVEDLDGDGVGDVCDDDDDGDAVADSVDNCPTLANPQQRDRDLDLLGDSCDPSEDRNAGADLVIAVDSTLPGLAYDQRCYSSGRGPFRCERLHGTSHGDARDIALADLDDDGIPEAVLAYDGAISQYCFDQGSLMPWGCYTADILHKNSAAVAIGDLDGDTFPDLVFANLDQPSTVCFGSSQTTPYVVCEVAFGPVATSFTTVGLLDADGDFDLDVLFGGAPGIGGERLCLNELPLGFDCTPLAGIPNTEHLAVGDFDGDGLTDIVSASADPSAGHGGHVCLSDGFGGFGTCLPTQGSPAAATHAVAVGDLDQDLDLDAVFATGGSGGSVCINDGTGQLSCHDVLPSLDTVDVALGDIDGDGQLDGVFLTTDSSLRTCFGWAAADCQSLAITSTPPQSQAVALGVFFDPNEVDEDADGLPNAIDNCPFVTNTDQADSDLDGIGDPCDTFDDQHALSGLGAGFGTTIEWTPTLSGQLHGGATWTTGQQGAALELDGTGYVEIVDAGEDWALDLETGLTLALWIRPDQLGETQVLVSKDEAYELEIGKLGVDTWDLRLDNQVIGQGQTPIVEGLWQHLAVTWNGQTLRYYYNGQPDGEMPFTGPLPTNDHNVGLGARPAPLHAGGPVFQFAGAINAFELFGRALEDSEIAALVSASQSDVVPPVRSTPSPTGPSPLFAPVDFGLDTDEPASCRFGESHPATPFDDLPGAFVTSDGLRHRATLAARSSPEVRIVQVRCRDTLGNTNTDNYKLLVGHGTSALGTGLVSWWAFDEGTGCTAADQTGLNTGTLKPLCPSSAPNWVDGVVGSGLEFATIRSEVRVDAPVGLSSLSELTVVVWVRPELSHRPMALVDHRDSLEDGYDLYLNVQGKPLARIDGVTLQQSTNTLSITSGRWHQVAATFDGTQLLLFLDGEIVAQRPAVLSQPIQVEAPLRIGRHFEDLYYTLTGSLDEVVIYDRALSRVEMAELFNLTRP